MAKARTRGVYLRAFVVDGVSQRGLICRDKARTRTRGVYLRAFVVDGVSQLSHAQAQSLQLHCRGAKSKGVLCQG